MEVGLRPGELYGPHANRVDRPRKLIYVTHVMTRYGLRATPKSEKSHRAVPVPARICDAMARLMEGRDAFATCTCRTRRRSGTRTYARALTRRSSRHGRDVRTVKIIPL